MLSFRPIIKGNWRGVVVRLIKQKGTGEAVSIGKDMLEVGGGKKLDLNKGKASKGSTKDDRKKTRERARTMQGVLGMKNKIFSGGKSLGALRLRS